jgi:signal transduction histidine kinase
MANEGAADRGAARIGEEDRGRGAGAWLVRAVAVASALTGAIVLVGWIADLPALTTAGAEIAMKANAAVCFVLLGVALWRRSRGGERPDRLAPALAVSAALVGGLTLLEHVLGVDLGIDQLLVHEAPGMPATASPGRMGPPAASSFLLLGTAIAVLHRRAGALRAAVPAIALGVAFAALLPLVGYAYGTRQLYGIARFTGIALPTAVLIEAIAVAVLVASGLGAALRRPSGATRLARRTLAYSTVVPLVAGWAVARGLSAGLYDGTFAVSFLVLALILAVTLLTWRDVAHVARLERRRERAEAARRESEERARARAAELEAVSRELREADRRKDAFLAVLSHELRNPLAPIRNSLFVLGHPGAGADRTRRAIEVIERQAGQLTRLVEDLLDLSRISRGKVRLQRARVDLVDIARRTVEDHRGPAAAAGLELVAELPDAPLWVDGDAARLAQVIGNLLANAVKFTPPGGRIHVAGATRGWPRTRAGGPAYSCVGRGGTPPSTGAAGGSASASPW